MSSGLYASNKGQKEYGKIKGVDIAPISKKLLLDQMEGPGHNSFVGSMKALLRNCDMNFFPSLESVPLLLGMVRPKIGQKMYR